MSMTDSTFNPETFLQTQYTEATDTKRIPVPAADYMGQINDVRPKRVTRQDGTTAIVMEIIWNVLGEAAQKATNLEMPTARQSIWLDLNTAGNIDMRPGLNIALGKLRDACNVNDSGKAWSPMMLKNMSAYIRVENEPDKDDPEIIYSNVVRVSRGPFSEKATTSGEAAAMPQRQKRA